MQGLDVGAAAARVAAPALVRLWRLCEKLLVRGNWSALAAGVWERL